MSDNSGRGYKRAGDSEGESTSNKKSKADNFSNVASASEQQRSEFFKQEIAKIAGLAHEKAVHSSISFAASVAEGTNVPQSSKKTLRRNIINLWNDPDQSQLDRFMIAFHRLQTEGRVEYRRLVGMHGGGGGTSDPKFEAILASKVKLDIVTHYNGEYPDNYWWPEPVPNAPYPTLQKPSPFTYTFCWHMEPEFLVWHRALMAEYEYLLQKYDPQTFKNEEERHSGPNALGACYWAWENWDGLTLPIQVSLPTYYVRTDKFFDKEKNRFGKGYSFDNPFYRWFAPVTVEQQKQEYFPDVLNDTNCTTRAQAFTNPSIPNEFPWQIKSEPGRPSMWEVVNHAMSQPDFKLFATAKPKYGDSKYSIEVPHNRFHNHMGGYTIGGPFGPGKQISPLPGDPNDPDYFTGTMTQNQSIFDPIFWLHHSNVERQLCSWKKIWYDSDGKPKLEISRPPPDVMAKVLYPWTKPELTAKGQQSWNTEVGSGNDATFADWWDAELTYEYEEYIPQLHTLKTLALSAVPERRVRLIAKPEYKIRGGEYSIFLNGELKASTSVLSAVNIGCARCKKRENIIDFDVSHFINSPEQLNEALQNQLVLKRNNVPIPVKEWNSEFF